LGANALLIIPDKENKPLVLPPQEKMLPHLTINMAILGLFHHILPGPI
jgi:hypothetical protein